MNTDHIRAQAKKLDELRESLKAAQINRDTVACRYGQVCASISINGIALKLSDHNRNYMPEVLKGMEAIQAEAIKLLDMRVATLKGLVEGAVWKLSQLAKATGSAA